MNWLKQLYEVLYGHPLKVRQGLAELVPLGGHDADEATIALRILRSEFCTGMCFGAQCEFFLRVHETHTKFRGAVGPELIDDAERHAEYSARGLDRRATAFTIQLTERRKALGLGVTAVTEEKHASSVAVQPRVILATGNLFGERSRLFGPARHRCFPGGAG